MSLSRFLLDYREKDGYTLEEIDIYGVKDGEEVIVSHKVGFKPISSTKILIMLTTSWRITGLCKLTYLPQIDISPLTARQCYVGRRDNPSFSESGKKRDIIDRC